MSDPLPVASKNLSKPLARRIGSVALVAVLAVTTVASLDAEAKRLGGGRTFGRQAQTTQTAPSTATQSQSQSSTQQNSLQSAQPAAAARTPSSPAQPAPARSRWLGPIAGLAAGLGIAALLSHFGLGGAFASMMANVIVIALLAMAGIWLVRKFMSRRREPVPAYGAAAAGAGGAPMRDFGVSRMQTAEPAASSGAMPGAAMGAASGAALPAGFDTETFLRHAKVNFVRLQAAWDEGNLADIREFTTPEMFAELKVDIDARGRERDQTDVVQLNAELIGVEDRGSEYLASVRFSGLIRESAGESAGPFVEVWNLSKAARTGEGWLLAGIQQIAQH
ncbi:MAG TPA: TIM44-like domain-containing protein [Trinickia sp.]|uniref:Tim44 domain-containing protein n=1 Tax=Trinickia sp. TaxID=2571163 RepID=UPI002F3F0159